METCVPPLSIFLAEMESITPPIRWHLLLAAAGVGGSIRARARMLVFAGNMLAVQLFILGIFYARIGACGIRKTRFFFRHTPGGENQTLSLALYSRTRGNVRFCTVETGLYSRILS